MDSKEKKRDKTKKPERFIRPGFLRVSGIAIALIVFLFAYENTLSGDTSGLGFLLILLMFIAAGSLIIGLVAAKPKE